MPMTAAILKTDSDVVKTEGPNRYSRDEVTVASGAGVITPGHVLGKVTATGKYVPLAPAASDGSQIAARISLQNANATSADATRVVVLSRLAEVVAQALVWPVGITANQKTAALAQLETAGIVARRGV
jgi:hypothetical protein